MKIYLTIVLFFLSNQFLCAQNTKPLVYCEDLLHRAQTKYEVVFNYASPDLNRLKCIDTLPATFKDFKTIANAFTGLNFQQFSKQFWVVRKNKHYQIQVLNESAEPIENAELKGTGLKSNFYGKLFLEAESSAGSYIISHPRYEDVILNISQNTAETITVQLQLKPILLETVNLLDLYVKGITLSSNNHIKVKLKQMPLVAGQTQQDALISLLNLPQITSPVESIAELNIKGGINDQNLVLWNGIRMFQNSHFFGLLSAFNEDLIQQITVIDNATPVEYGNAVTGTIQLDFDETLVDKNTYGIGVNALSGQAFSKIALNNTTEFSFALQRSFTDFFNSSTFQSYTEKAFRDTDLQLFENSEIDERNISRANDFYFTDAQFQLKKQFSDALSIKLNGIWFENELVYTEVNNNFDQKTSNYNTDNGAIGLDTHYDLSPNQYLELKANYSLHKSSGNNNTFTGNLNTIQSNTVENYTVQFIWASQINNYNRLLAGFDFQGSLVSNNFTNFTTEAFLNQVQISNVYSGFFSDTYHKKKWRIYAGLKGVYYQRDKQFNLEPRLDVNYEINKTFSLAVRGEMKSQNFKQIIDLDQNFLGIEKRRWVVSGDSISPSLQKSQQIEALLKWNLRNIGGYASLYARNLTGISGNNQRFQNENQFQNLDEIRSEIFGASLHLYYKNDWLNSWLSYAHLSETLRFSELQFNGSNQLNHEITWGNNIRYNNWNVSFAILYHSGLPFTAIDNDNPVISLAESRNRINFLTLNAHQLPDYFRVDTSLQYTLKTNDLGNFKFNLGIKNLTNYHNVLRRNFRLNRVNEADIIKIENLGLGFTFNFGVFWSL